MHLEYLIFAACVNICNFERIITDIVLHFKIISRAATENIVYAFPHAKQKQMSTFNCIQCL